MTKYANNIILFTNLPVRPLLLRYLVAYVPSRLFALRYV